MNKFINLVNTRRDDQKKVMDEIAKAGHCPFCPEQLEKYQKMPVLKTGRFWKLYDNQWPYEKIKHQLLAIHISHIEHIKDLEEGAGEELMQMFVEEAKKRNIPGGGIAIRFGRSDKGSYGNTVYHLHAHLIEPDLEKLASDEAWRFKFGEPLNYKKKTA